MVVANRSRSRIVAFPVLTTAKDTLKDGPSQRLLIWWQLANAIEHVVLKDD